MANPKKAPSVTNSAYKIGAAARRAKVASVAPAPNEITPVQGLIRASLDGKPISSERQSLAFGPSSVSIPEFSVARKSQRD